jgi:hypothetical protein
MPWIFQEAEEPPNSMSLRRIDVFDPPLCCSTGVCGPTVDPELVRAAALFERLQLRGIQVCRRNLAQEPLAFVQRNDVRQALEQQGVGALPLVFVDDILFCSGRYPSEAESRDWEPT